MNEQKPSLKALALLEMKRIVSKVSSGRRLNICYTICTVESKNSLRSESMQTTLHILALIEIFLRNEQQSVAWRESGSLRLGNWVTTTWQEYTRDTASWRAIFIHYCWLRTLFIISYGFYVHIPLQGNNLSCKSHATLLAQPSEFPS